jgi:hypothetical protein
VAPYLLLFTTVVCVQGHSIRRISNGRQRSGPAGTCTGTGTGGQYVTSVTVLGRWRSPNLTLSRTAFELLTQLSAYAVCHVPDAKAAGNAGDTGTADADPDRDTGRLFVGNFQELYELNLTRGKRRSWEVSSMLTGLAPADEAGARLLVVCMRHVYALDTRTGALTSLISSKQPRNITDMTELAPLHYAGAAVDHTAGALLFCNYQSHVIYRLLGIRP